MRGAHWWKRWVTNSFFSRGMSGKRVLRADFEALVLIFPHSCGVVFEQTWGELGADAGEQCFGFLGRIFVSAVIISGALALAIIPMRDGVNGSVLGGPCFDVLLQCGRDIVERHERVAAMLAEQACVADIASQERKHWRAAAR